MDEPVEVERAWHKAPAAPFFVLRVSWRAIDRIDPLIVMEGSSWMGWMAAEPAAGWVGLMEDIQALAPEGAVLRSGAQQAQRRPEATLDMFAPMLAPGSSNLWIDSDETIYHDMSSPRIRLLDVVSEFGCEDIPREWKKEWDDGMSERALGSAQAKFESLIAKRGFGNVEFMGRHNDIAGASHWCNLAVEKWPGWVARVQAGELDASIPKGNAPKGRSSI